MHFQSNQVIFIYIAQQKMTESALQSRQMEKGSASTQVNNTKEIEGAKQ